MRNALQTGLKTVPTIALLAGVLAAPASAQQVVVNEGEGPKVRRFAEFSYAARSWHTDRRIIARIEASAPGH